MSPHNFLYHHCIDLKYLKKGILNYKDYATELYIPSYTYLSNLVGFWPHFVAVGRKLEDIYLTGYYNQFYKKINRYDKKTNKYKKIKNNLNYVLLCYKNLDGIFTDYDMWEDFVCSIGHLDNGIKDIFKSEKWAVKRLLKPSWNKPDWVRFVNKNHVQLITSFIDTSKADAIFCKNKKTVDKLEEKGFNNVYTFRMKVRDE
jgi:hypothetical protein